MGGFGVFVPYDKEDIEAYLRRFTSFLFTKGVTVPVPLVEGASAAAQTIYKTQVINYNHSRKSWLLASLGPDW